MKERRLLTVLVVLAVIVGGGALVFTALGGTNHGGTYPNSKYYAPGLQAAPGTELSTTINLLPAGGSNPISSVSNGTNVFPVSYSSDGVSQVTYAGNVPLSFLADSGTNVTVAGVSLDRGNASGEVWVLDSGEAAAAFPAGSSVTFYYYNLLEQPAYYAVLGGGSPPAPVITYFTAPSGISTTGKSAEATLLLTSNPSTIWGLAGTEASVPTSSFVNSTARWATGTSAWNLTAPLQISQPIDYYHQYYLTFQYSVTGSQSGYSGPTISCPSFGGTQSVPAGSSAWADAPRGDAYSTCAYSSVLPGSSDSVRWAAQTESVTYEGSGTVSLNYWLQYPLSVVYDIVGAMPDSPPSVTATSFGYPSTASVATNGSAVWMDEGSQYAISNPLPLSNATERWTTTSGTTGTLNHAETVSLVFYQQFLLSASYNVVGPGSPEAPSMSYTSFGTPESATLSPTPQSLWADGNTTYSAPAELSGSNSTVRWYCPGSAGVANQSLVLALAYHHQYIITITGGGLSSQWFDVNAMANITISGVYDRLQGTGQRVTSYTLNGQSPVSVPPTTGNISVSVEMQSPRTLSISSVTQYQLSLDSATMSAEIYVTPPTIAGDNYWYDAGSNVSVVLNGAWDRNNGTGFRLASYTLDGGSQVLVASSTPVTALSTSSISSPQSLSSSVVTQYYVAVTSGSLLSMSQTPIPSDTGWYDQGTIVNATFNNVWDSVANQSRLDAVGYAFNSGQETMLTRSGTGTFVIPLPVAAPLNVSIASVTQYELNIFGDPYAKPTVPSPTGDSYFDAGTKLAVTTPNAFGVVNGTSRVRLVSFTLAGATANVTKVTGSTTTPSFVLNSGMQVAFETMTQYLVSLHFTDSTGSATIAPKVFSVSYSGGTEELTSSKAWFDSGTQIEVTGIQWEGVEVPTVGSPGLQVTSPQTLTVPADVFQSSLKVTDLLGLPVSGIQVTITFGNKSTTSLVSDGSGVVSLGLLPAGDYEASAAGLAGASNITVNPASDPNAVVNVTLSYTLIGIIVAAALLVVVGVVVVAIRRSRSRKER